jgi:hypothetical protein
MSKKRKSFLPKRIAGVKVPKAVRKGRFGELLASPAGQALLAEAVMAVGAVAGAKKVAEAPQARETLKAAAGKVRDAAADAGKSTTAASGVLAYALGEAARSFTEALHRQSDETSTASADGWADPSGDGSKKKPTSYEAGPL